MITVFYILVNYPFNSSFKQNHITTVIYWNMLDSCVKTGRTIEYLEYFMLSCSTLRFLLHNSDVPQSCNAPSEQEGMSSFLSRVNVRDRVTEAPQQASMQESYNRKSVYLTLELSGWPQYPPQGQQRRGWCWQELNPIFSFHTPFPGALSSGLDYFCAARANTFRSCQRIHSKSRAQARLSSFHKNPASNSRFLTLTHTVTSKSI